MGKKIGAWIGVGTCAVLAAVLLNGCTESFDVIVINTTDETISVKLGLRKPLTVEPNSYKVQEKGLRDLTFAGNDFEVFSEDGRLLGIIKVPKSRVSDNLYFKNLYVLTVAETDLMTTDELIDYEADRQIDRQMEFVLIATVDLEFADLVTHLFQENGIEIEGYTTPRGFNIKVMRNDKAQAVELLEQNAEENGYENNWRGR
ncbi:MAG: hypothetical protein IH944_06720 [Armatimonadetes bacterium]|nr:hypothetical protein [Armatimonadota bacterium]